MPGDREMAIAQERMLRRVSKEQKAKSAVDDYVAIDAVNWSTLKLMATSALLCRYRADHPEPDKESYRIGRALHVATLEPERWAREYVVEPDFGPQFTAKGEPASNRKATKGYKEALAAWKATLKPCAQVLDPDDYALVTTCAESVRRHRVAGPMLKGGRCEHTITWIDPVTGVKCKGRVDLVDRSIVDLKGTHRQNVRSFLYDAAAYLYHGQLAWYHDAAVLAGEIPANADYPVVIGVQTVEPFDVIPLKMIPESYEAGRNLYRQLIDRYVQCQAAGWWPGLCEDFVLWELPRFALGVEQAPEEDAW